MLSQNEFPDIFVLLHIKFITFHSANTQSSEKMFLSMKSYRPRLIIDLNDRDLILVSSKIEIVVNNPILTKHLKII